MGVWIRHYEYMRHLREVVSLVSVISVCKGEVHRGYHDAKFAQRPLASRKY